MSTETWIDRGDSAAREDLRAGHAGEWDRAAVLSHLGIATEDDVDAVAYGLAGDDLDTAQSAALAGYARARSFRDVARDRAESYAAETARLDAALTTVLATTEGGTA